MKEPAFLVARHRWRRVVAPPLLGTLAWVPVACGDDDDDEAAPTPTERTEACDAYRELRSQIDELREVDLVEEGTNALRDEVEDVRAALDDLRVAVKEQTREEVDDANDALGRLSTTVSTARLSDGLAAAAAVGEAISDVAESFEAVREDLDDCR